MDSTKKPECQVKEDIDELSVKLNHVKDCLLVSFSREQADEIFLISKYISRKNFYLIQKPF